MTRVLVTGADGMLGSAFCRIYPNFIAVNKQKYDLTDADETKQMILVEKPDIIIHAAAKVGGVLANTRRPADFFCENAKMNINILEQASKLGVKKVVSVMSSCIYPNEISYPLKEENLHLGPPHESNFGFAYAKRILDIYTKAIRQQYGYEYITVILNNLYGPKDNFDKENSHFIPALIRKVIESKQTGQDLVVWGDGTPEREFTYIDDAVKLIMYAVYNYKGSEPINLGNPQVYKIKEVVEILTKVLSYDGGITWDTTKPNGQNKKPSSFEKLNSLGFANQYWVELEEGLARTCDWYQNSKNIRGVS
jgi:GDP-L-fucose synthase